eukprot:m.269212 g.269212  ORF g.269212 m.269212 type:complete len:181 (-) comp22820_c6_seq1:3349-3891(-)
MQRLLQLIGWQERAADFEWLEQEGGGGFLPWLADRLSADNVLSNQDVQLFQEVRSSGLALEGNELQRALDSFAQLERGASSQALQAESVSLRREIELLDRQMVRSKAQLSKLSAHHSALAHAGERQEALQEHSARHCAQALAANLDDNRRANSAVSRLAQRSQDLGRLHQLHQQQQHQHQ